MKSNSNLKSKSALFQIQILQEALKRRVIGMRALDREFIDQRARVKARKSPMPAAAANRHRPLERRSRFCLTVGTSRVQERLISGERDALHADLSPIDRALIERSTQSSANLRTFFFTNGNNCRKNFYPSYNVTIKALHIHGYNHVEKSFFFRSKCREVEEEAARLFGSLLILFLLL